MAFCTNCGSRIEGDAKYCTNCGNSLEMVELPALELMLDLSDDPQAAQQPVADAQPAGQAQPNPAAYQQPRPEQQSYQQPYGQPQPQQQYYQQPQPDQQSYQQPYQQPQPATFAPSAQPASNDTGSIGWGVLGFFIPLVGIILFLVWRTNKPNNAKVALIGAGIGILLGIVMQFMAH